MGAVSEINAIEAVDSVLAQLEDQDARERVLQWAWSKHSRQPLPIPGEQLAEPSRKRRTRAPRKKKTTKKSPSIVKDLDLRPEGKQGFSEFGGEKNPTTHLMKCTVAVYYLGRVLGVAGININHVFTCFRDANWRLPSDLQNTLWETASRHGWLDTTDMDNIALTTRGETMVEYDLPGTSAAGDS